MMVTYNEVMSMFNIKDFSFDTLQYANRLKSVGIPEEQANMQAELQAETVAKQASAINNIIDKSLATKQDINELKLNIKELDLKIETLRAETSKNISQLGYKLGGTLGGIAIVGVTILGFLIQLHH